MNIAHCIAVAFSGLVQFADYMLVLVAYDDCRQAAPFDVGSMKVVQCLQLDVQTAAIVKQFVETIIQNPPVHGKTDAYLAGETGKFFHKRRIVVLDTVGGEIHGMTMMQCDFDQVKNTLIKSWLAAEKTPVNRARQAGTRFSEIVKIQIGLASLRVVTEIAVHVTPLGQIDVEVGERIIVDMPTRAHKYIFPGISGSAPGRPAHPATAPGTSRNAASVPPTKCRSAGALA